jgi:PAS domain S-box-containing protein
MAAQRTEGWAQMFWTCFKRSRSPMALLDERRRCIEVNGALLNAVGYRRDALVGRPLEHIVKSEGYRSDAEWRAQVARGDFSGEAELECADGGRLAVQWAAHPEVVTGRRLVLYVALSTARRGRFARPTVKRGDLSRREREVLHHVALGRSGPEIADELQIAHDTVRTHVRNAQGKLGARSRAQLVAIALGDGHAPHGAA